MTRISRPRQRRYGKSFKALLIYVDVLFICVAISRQLAVFFMFPVAVLEDVRLYSTNIYIFLPLIALSWTSLLYMCQ
jgi:hypothetical protein